MISQDPAMAMFARRVSTTGKLWLKFWIGITLALLAGAGAALTLPVAYWILFSPVTLFGRLTAAVLIIPSTILVGSLLWVIGDAAIVALEKEADADE